MASKRDARNQKKGTLLDNITDHAYEGLCTPLPPSPLRSPCSKKLCSQTEDEPVSNSDILKAINSLNDRFSNFVNMVLNNTAEIATVKENMKSLEMQYKETGDSVLSLKNQLSTMQEKQDDAERYSRRWNLRLLNLPEKPNEDVRKEVLEIINQIIPEERSKLGFMVDTVHRIGRPRENQSMRPVIIQFTMRTFRYKVWKASLTANIMKEKKLRMAEDLTYQEKQSRNKLWPLVQQARTEGKKTKWQGPVAIIDGVRYTA